MKQKITITNGESTIFKGRIANVAIKKGAIVQKSIELFDDDDPCIIHQSYVVKEYVDDMLRLFKDNDTKTINVKDYQEKLKFLDYKDIETLTINLL